MINQYIRDPQLKTLWDINNPHIRSHHERLMREWIQMAEGYRHSIHRSIPNTNHSLEHWIYSNVELLQTDPKLTLDPGDSPCYNDLIMDAYLEWGVRNYPITPRITEYTLQCLEAMYSGDNPELMYWDDYIEEVEKIIQYQTDQNLKPFEKMTREELLRWMQQQPESTVRRAVSAVTQ